jgi:large subunit ribosomal protein L6
MSRVGKLPVELPAGVKVESGKDNYKVIGPKGEVEGHLPKGISLEEKEGGMLVKIGKDSVTTRMYQGTVRSILSSLIHGVTEGWKRELDLVGTGYRAEVRDGNLVITIGFSHPVEVKAPKDISFKVEKSRITVEGIDKQLVGEMAAEIRAIRPPEPYKGKGIMYVGEQIRRKAGKAAKAQGAA